MSTLEELKEKARLTDEELAEITNPMIMIDPRVIAKAQQDKDWQTFIKFCEERNIKQVVESEFVPIRFFHPEDGANVAYNKGKDDMLKWHKGSLKSVKEVMR